MRSLFWLVVSIAFIVVKCQGKGEEDEFPPTISIKPFKWLNDNEELISSSNKVNRGFDHLWEEKALRTIDVLEHCFEWTDDAKELNDDVEGQHINVTDWLLEQQLLFHKQVDWLIEQHIQMEQLLFEGQLQAINHELMKLYEREFAGIEKLRRTDWTEINNYYNEKLKLELRDFKKEELKRLCVEHVRGLVWRGKQRRQKQKNLKIQVDVEQTFDELSKIYRCH